jgi:tyrosine-specific transport protein
MTCTGLIFLEVALWMKGDTNIVSMAEKTLGVFGKTTAWCLYIFLFYSLTLAYVSGCGSLISQIFPTIVPEGWGPVFFTIVFAPFIYLGARAVGRINTVFMVGLGVCFFSFIYLGYGYVNFELLERKDWVLSLVGLPVAFTAFAYQGTVPTLVRYLDYNPNSARKAIIIGSSIPFFTYLIWQGLILGIVPTYGEGGLAEALANDDNAVYPLRNFIDNPTVYTVGQFFAFFAMVTSFFGVTLGLHDFLADGLKVKKTPLGRLFLCGVVFVPPLVISLFNPRIFLLALSLAGGFGCATLLGLLPIAMVWTGRYKMNLESSYSLTGGKALLLFLAGFVIFEICVQIALMAGILK